MASLFVRHRKRPDWGIGKVVDETEANIVVYFKAGLLRVLARSIADLEDVPDEKVPATDSLRRANPLAKKPPSKKPGARSRKKKASVWTVPGGGFETVRRKH